MKSSRLSRILLLICAVVLCSQSITAQKKRKLGLVRDDKKYLHLPKRSKNFSLMRGILPSTFNLKSFVPQVEDQGDFSTCVGWSTAYYMRTIMQAKKLNIKGPETIRAIAFSPTFVFERIKSPTDYQCQTGSSISDALDIMKEKGVATLKSAPYACGNKYTMLEEEAAANKIEGYTTLFDIPSTASVEEKILSIKTALVESQNAVLIGMWIPNSFFQAKEVWKAAPAETIKNAVGGHAMAVIGYDDTKNAFLIVNSWGNKWANNGFVWASYKDLIEFTPYAYEVLSPITPVPVPTPVPVVPSNNTTTDVVPPAPVQPVQEIFLKGSIKPLLANGDLMPVSTSAERGLDVTNDANIDMITYNVTKEYPSGTSFKTEIINNISSYMYIIASDDNNRVTKLFPYDDEVSALIPSNNIAMLPSTNSSFTMDNKPGNDYFLVLYSTKELDIDKLKNDIANAQGEFKQKVYSVIGKDLVSADTILYESNNIAFELKGTPNGTIVPLLLKIKHMK
ncbi:hypothetical protein ABID42_001629 [Arcicella rosea]|uniref:C1 family peptidase n=1 Tax=Arcicella rosea TaxID=502909 RepID=UPI00345DEA5F